MARSYRAMSDLAAPDLEKTVGNAGDFCVQKTVHRVRANFRNIDSSNRVKRMATFRGSGTQMKTRKDRFASFSPAVRSLSVSFAF